MIPDNTTANYASAAYEVWSSNTITWSSFEQRFQDPDDGGAGVREPRRPQPHHPAGAMSLPIP